MKTYITLMTGILITVLSMQSLAQQVVFEYDDAGNRISRTIDWDEEKIEPETVFDTTLYKQDELTEDDIVKHSAILGEQTINIYPNPTKGTFKVGFEGWEKELEITIKLHSLNGNLIFDKQVHNSVTSLDIVSQPNGTYVLTIIIEGKKEIWKIIKK